MSKLDAILNGVKVGIFCIDVMLAVNAFVKGDVIIGALFILVGILMLSTMRFKKKPGIEFEIKKVSKDEMKEIDKLLNGVTTRTFIDKSAIDGTIDLIEHIETFSDEPEYKKGFDSCKKMCLKIIKVNCHLEDDDNEQSGV